MIYDVHLTSNFVRADVCLCSYAKIVFEKLVSTNHSLAFAQKATDKFMVYLNVLHLCLNWTKILTIDIPTILSLKYILAYFRKVVY